MDVIAFREAQGARLAEVGVLGIAHILHQRDVPEAAGLDRAANFGRLERKDHRVKIRLERAFRDPAEFAEILLRIGRE